MNQWQEENALWAALKDGDDTAKLALADWCQEHQQPLMAHALKWCAKRGYWPRVSPKERHATWGRQDKRFSRTGAHLLPYHIYDAYERNLAARFTTVRGALTALALALDDLSRLLRVPGEGGGP